MSSLLSEIHFWTSQEDVITTNSYYGSFKYYPKKENSDVPSKKIYCNQRGILWNPTNKRQNRLKDRLKELEDSLIQNKIINYLWKENTLQLLLSTGLLICIKINERTGDPVNITFDKQLSAKLQVNIICDGLILGQQVICICNDGHVLGYGGSWKDGWLLEGGPRRRVHSYSNWLVVWGRPGSEHPQPWSPLANDHQRANLQLYWLGLRSPELLAYKNTDGEPFIIRVSTVFEHTLISVEQKVTKRGTVSVEVSTLELSNNILKTIAITAVPLQTHVSCCELSPNEEYLLICCIDSTIAILDRNSGSTKTVKASFIPKICTWHKSGALVVISNENGQLQYYDVALNNVKSQIMGEDEAPTPVLDLTGYFNSQVSVVSLNWENGNLLIALEQGPIVCVTHVDKALTFVSLAQRYIHVCEVKKAVALLLNWKFGEESFFVLQKITLYLLKKPLTEEIAQQLQDALGSFHAATIPLDEDVRNQFKKQVLSLTRRFFHQLVRARMYETAFLLAVDMMQHDLFMDLHYIASKIGETEMAAAARAQASALVSRCSSEASNCSRSSCSECSSPGHNTKEKSFSNEISNKASDMMSDNLLSTNFNQPDVKNYVPQNSTYEASKMVSSIGNYVKPPQVPTNFSKPTLSYVPPLPLSNTIPNLVNNTIRMPNIGMQLSNNIQKNPQFVWNEKPNLTNNAFMRLSSNSNSLGTLHPDFRENKLTVKGNAPNFIEPNQEKPRFIENYQIPSYRELLMRTSFSDSLMSTPELSLPTNTIRKYPQRLNMEQNGSSLSDSLTNIPELSQPTNTIRKYPQRFNTEQNGSSLSRFSDPLINTLELSQPTNTIRKNPQRLNMEQNASSISRQNLNPLVGFHAFNKSSLGEQKSTFVPTKPIITPPLPVTNITHNFPPRNTLQMEPAVSKSYMPNLYPPVPPSTTLKKPQPKVKFSDTVTAFIVPEVKRPVRPAPPPHVTDPQRELADSLPLCHPNEDYLKDFAPVKSNEENGENRNPPKIKVVHFGVV